MADVWQIKNDEDRGAPGRRTSEILERCSACRSDLCINNRRGLGAICGDRCASGEACREACQLGCLACLMVLVVWPTGFIERCSRRRGSIV